MSYLSIRGNIRQKISDVRGAGKGGALENVQRAIEQLKEDIQERKKNLERRSSRSGGNCARTLQEASAGNRSSMPS